ncbi:LysR family transcriptional regulator [Halomonas cupida]|uniref:LysR family transcriptional regulator n=1 Tax=Halomonas cupida TaxID=44933 RepID=A0A1M7BVX6_9GAMM|nr:LysR substrate-binding domain-containing protein [Halomonas cupida]GEN24652.1 LysR family transcriptional regulator [Halomonas cupida]SHL59016.1 transcriptional regulator, LysR family [Halomonas cupida]
MQDLNDLYYFAQVVDHGGFAAAGRALGMPRSRLSRRIAALEAGLDVRLIHRSTRQFVVTELGQMFYRHCREMLWQAEAAEEVVARHRAEPRGRIRLSCPPSLLEALFTPLLTRFMHECSQIQLDVVATSRRVDVVREGFDLAIRVRYPPLEDSDLILKVLSRSPERILAAPSLVEQLGMPSSPQDLALWPSLDFDELNHRHRWCLENPDGERCEVTHQPRLITDDVRLLHRACLEGQGVARLPLVSAGVDLQRRQLVDVVPGWEPRAGIVHAVYPSRRGQLPSVRALLDFLADGLGQEQEDTVLTNPS